MMFNKVFNIIDRFLIKVQLSTTHDDLLWKITQKNDVNQRQYVHTFWFAVGKCTSFDNLTALEIMLGPLHIMMCDLHQK